MFELFKRINFRCLFDEKEQKEIRDVANDLFEKYSGVEVFQQFPLFSRILENVFLTHNDCFEKISQCFYYICKIASILLNNPTETEIKLYTGIIILKIRSIIKKDEFCHLFEACGFHKSEYDILTIEKLSDPTKISEFRDDLKKLISFSFVAMVFVERIQGICKELPEKPIKEVFSMHMKHGAPIDELVKELQPHGGLQPSASSCMDESMKEEQCKMDKILAERIQRGDTADEEMEDLTKLHQWNDGKVTHSQPSSSIASPAQQCWTCEYCRYANTDFTDEKCVKCSASRFHSDHSPSLQQDHLTPSRPGRGDGDTAAIGTSWLCHFCKKPNPGDGSQENCLHCSKSKVEQTRHNDYHSKSAYLDADKPINTSGGGDSSVTIPIEHVSSSPGQSGKYGRRSLGVHIPVGDSNPAKSSSRRSDVFDHAVVGSEFWPCLQSGCTSMNRNDRFTCQGCGKPKRTGGGGNVYPTLSDRKEFPVSLHDGGSTSVGYAGAGSSSYADIAKKSPQKTDSDGTELIKSWHCKQCTFVNKQHKNFCEVCGATNDEADPTMDEKGSPVSSAVIQSVCHTCGHRNNRFDTHCKRCHKKMSKGETLV